MWQDTTTKVNFKNVGALSDCSIVLYVMTERWPESRKYRDLFEAVKKSVLEAIEEGRHFAPTAVTSLHASLRDFPVDTTMESVSDDLEQMIRDITGESIPFWTGTDVSMNDEQDFAEILEPSIEIFEQQTWNNGFTWSSI
jgi:hypothetical protein